MKAAGVLTEAEFTTQKAALLAGGTAQPAMGMAVAPQAASRGLERREAPKVTPTEAATATAATVTPTAAATVTPMAGARAGRMAAVATATPTVAAATATPTAAVWAGRASRRTRLVGQSPHKWCRCTCRPDIPASGWREPRC